MLEIFRIIFFFFQQLIGRQYLFHGFIFFHRNTGVVNNVHNRKLRHPAGACTGPQRFFQCRDIECIIAHGRQLIVSVPGNRNDFTAAHFYIACNFNDFLCHAGIGNDNRKVILFHVCGAGQLQMNIFI